MVKEVRGSPRTPYIYKNNDFKRGADKLWIVEEASWRQRRAEEIWDTAKPTSGLYRNKEEKACK